MRVKCVNVVGRDNELTLRSVLSYSGCMEETRESTWSG